MLYLRSRRRSLIHRSSDDRAPHTMLHNISRARDARFLRFADNYRAPTMVIIFTLFMRRPFRQYGINGDGAIALLRARAVLLGESIIIMIIR